MFDLHTRIKIPTDISVISYPGAKSRVRKMLYGILPRGTREICSPFLGAGGFELYCAYRGIKVYGSDVWEPLLHFWYAIQKDAKRVSDIARTYWPGSRDKYYELVNGYDSITDEYEKAAVFFFLNKHSYGALTFKGYIGGDPPDVQTGPIDTLGKFHAPNLHIEKLDYREALKKHEGMITYLDPPYMIDDYLYGRKGELHNGFDHEELSSILHSRDNWILSYNDNEVLRDMYKEYRIYTPKWTYTMQNCKPSKEILVVNI